MFLRGTRILTGEDAFVYSSIIEKLKQYLRSNGFMEVILPNISELSVFTDKAGPEISEQIYGFKDKGGRDICLNPEITALIQKIYRESWSKNLKKPVKIFYAQKCYRYERPQAGRYREFTQFGLEILGDYDYNRECKALLKECLDLISGSFPFVYSVQDSVKRGLHYYTEDGFEATVDLLGAQKQIAGGGRYAEGCGWAIGIDRLFLAFKREAVKKKTDLEREGILQFHNNPFYRLPS